VFYHNGSKSKPTEARQPHRSVHVRFYEIVRATADWARKNGVYFRPLRFHDVRHRHAVDWLKSGRSLYDLKERLGHPSIKTTEVYLAYLTRGETSCNARASQSGRQNVVRTFLLYYRGPSVRVMFATRKSLGFAKPI
jgi:integrase